MKARIAKFNELIGLDIEELLRFCIASQCKSGWSEEIREGSTSDPAPLVSSQMIIGLLPYLKIEEFECLKLDISGSIEQALEFLVSSFGGEGWSDYSGGFPIIDASGAAITAIVSCLTHGIIVPNAQESVIAGIKFLKMEQNTDNGWSLRKGGESKIQYTYWALRALHAFVKFRSESGDSCILKIMNFGKNWILENLKANNYGGFSISQNRVISAVATALGTELLGLLEVQYEKELIIDYFKKNQVERGLWAQETDTTTVGAVPRRVYIFGDTPRILECLGLLGVRFDSNLFVHTLNRIKELRLNGGGFAADSQNLNSAIGWFTAETLKMMSSLLQKFHETFENYTDLGQTFRVVRIHTFTKAVLMIGRFRPPHIGHYKGLEALVGSRKEEFFLPSEAVRELLNIDKVFLGIARYEVTRENPFTTGEVIEIWRNIIDNDTTLREFSSLIEIITCPARSEPTNIVDAINEITYRKESVIVATGNSRIVEQCINNGIKYVEFKRDHSTLSGSGIRETIAKIDFDNLDLHKTEIQCLQEQLHQIAFQTMMRDGILKRAARIITAV